MQPLAGKPLIEYPCSWQWRLIGRDPQQMRTDVAEVLSERGYALREANQSPAGRWLSMNLEVEVSSEADRNEIHRALTAQQGIRLAL